MKYSIFILPFAGVILAVACGRTFLSWLLAHPWMVLLGEASYALYIIHWSGQTFLQMRFLGAYGTGLVHAVFLVATVGVSLLCYRLIEVPMRRRLRGTIEPLAVSDRNSADGEPANWTNRLVVTHRS